VIFQSNFFGKIGKRTPLHEVGSPHGENPFMGFGKGLKEKVAYHKVEDGIPQKFQDLVRFFYRRVGLMNKRLMGERLVQPFDMIELITETGLQFF
jgi:hypothetical protein